MKILQILKEVISQKPDKITTSYTERGRFYSLEVDGEKISNYRTAAKLIEDLTGLELPIKSMYHGPKLLDIQDALKKQGIEMDRYEMDVS